MIFVVCFQKGNGAALIEPSVTKREFVLAYINPLFSCCFQIATSSGSEAWPFAFSLKPMLADVPLIRIDSGRYA
jgi:hypothetical protein